jgi:hypothetical protein
MGDHPQHGDDTDAGPYEGTAAIRSLLRWLLPLAIVEDHRRVRPSRSSRSANRHMAADLAQPGWREWAALAQSVVESILYAVVGLGAALSVLVPFPHLVSRLPPLLRDAEIVSLLATIGCLAALMVLAIVARRLRLPLTRPLVIYPFLWLIDAEERFYRSLHPRQGPEPPRGSPGGPGQAP